MKSLTTQISSIGILDADRRGFRMQKNFLVYLAIFMSLGGLVWGSISLFYGLVSQSLIPYSYVIVSFLNIGWFSKSKNFKLARGIQILISLLLPFVFQWSLGGFESSGVMMLWAILALMASLTFQDSVEAGLWLMLFVMLTIYSWACDGIFKLYKPEILPDFSVNFLFINIVTLTMITFSLSAFFVKHSIDAQRTLIDKINVLEKQKLVLSKHAVKQLKQDKKKSNKARDFFEERGFQTC